MRSALALFVLPAIISGAQAADIKGASRIDAVTVYPSGAEITRVGKVKLEGGDHVILFTDLPARAIHSSIRVEGKATGTLEIGSVDSRRMFVPRTDDAVAATERKRRRGCHREAEGRAGPSCRPPCRRRKRRRR